MLLFLYNKVSTNTPEEAQSESVYWAQCSVLFNYRVTESQNCQGRHLCRSPCPTGLHKQDHVGLVAQRQIQMALNTFKDGDSITLLKNLLLCFTVLAAIFFFNWNFMQCTGISLLPPIWYLNTLKNSPQPSLFQYKQIHLSQPIPICFKSISGSMRDLLYIYTY